MKYYYRYLFGTCLFFMFLSSPIVSADCDIWVYSSQGLPVANVEVYFRNITDNTTLYNTTTDSNGYAVYSENCINISIKTDYPSTAYSAVLGNVSAYTTVHINDWIAGRVQLKNTLGQYLDGQDCSVSAYAVNTSILIHDYDTQCQDGEPYLDSNGNWASVTDCKFTDSMGWYYFKGRTDESLGYEYDHFYDLVFVCNGETTKTTFQTDLEKQVDINKIEDFAQRFGGLILIGIVTGILVVLFIIMVGYALSQSSKTKGG